MYIAVYYNTEYRIRGNIVYAIKLKLQHYRRYIFIIISARVIIIFIIILPIFGHSCGYPSSEHR